MLLDTGLGIADIAAAIEPVAVSPVSVVNSHTHFDHVGGNDLFDLDVRCTSSDPSGWRRTPSSGSSTPTARSPPIWPSPMGGWWSVDREGSFLLGPDQRVRPWPAKEIAAAGGWRIDVPAPDRLLADGDRLELGDRSLRVIHTPGHAPDHICLLDEAEGILFAQDQTYYGPHLIYLPGSDVGDFARSVRRLADELRGSLRAVYVAHCLRPSVPPVFLDELADAAEEVAAGEAELAPAPGLFGEPVRGADYGHFSILVPPEANA